MSKSEQTASDAVQDEQNTDSVYDFFYHDARRVGSFLAQFDSSGHLKQISETESASKDAKRGYNVSLGGKIPIPGSLDAAEGNVSFGRNPGQSGSEESSRVYDPFWTNARTFLDYLDERKLIQKDVSKARLGQFVLISGALSVIDVATLKDAWNDKVINKLIRSGATPALTASQKHKGQNAPSQFDLIMTLIQILPHTLQAKIENPELSVWCNLERDSIVGEPSDLGLKHGATIAGTWSMMAILDALPSAVDIVGDMQTLVTAGLTTPGAHVASTLAPMARQLFGRPTACYGVTPLLIFREISG